MPVAVSSNSRSWDASLSERYSVTELVQRLQDAMAREQRAESHVSAPPEYNSLPAINHNASSGKNRFASANHDNE